MSTSKMVYKSNVYITLLVCWLALVLIGKFIKRAYLLPYRYQFHAFTYMICLVVEMNLFFTELFLPTLSFWGIVALYFFIFISGYTIHGFKIKELRKRLYNQSTHQLSDKIAGKIAIYGQGIWMLELLSVLY